MNRLRLLCAVLCSTVILTLSVPTQVRAAAFAEMVIDARSGQVLHSSNADTRLHPASLTKMMTLYIAFEAVRLGEITLDTPVRVSQNAASEPPSKLGLRSGQRIALRYLIRASAVKSANDAATAIAEAISGSEAAFARRMNRTAAALGMTNTTFRNAHGLTAEGHLSTARDMTALGRRLYFDYQPYYHLFSQRSAETTMGRVNNTNRPLLNSYRGADGIKTGYTQAAGWNLVASAERGNVRIIATLFGGRSSSTRNARVAQLLDIGFRAAPASARTRVPDLPSYGQPRGPLAVSRSLRPEPRPERPDPADPAQLLALQSGIADALAEATAAPEADALGGLAATPPPPRADTIAQLDPAIGADDDPDLPLIEDTATLEATLSTSTEPDADALTIAQLDATEETLPSGPRFITVSPLDTPTPRVITRSTAPANGDWRVVLGAFNTMREAEHTLLQVAIRESNTLRVAERNVARRSGGFEAEFTGLSEHHATLACRRLRAQRIDCEPLAPS